MSLRASDNLPGRNLSFLRHLLASHFFHTKIARLSIPLFVDRMSQMQKNFMFSYTKTRQNRPRVFLVVSLQTTKDLVLVKTGGVGVAGGPLASSIISHFLSLRFLFSVSVALAVILNFVSLFILCFLQRQRGYAHHCLLFVLSAVRASPTLCRCVVSHVVLPQSCLLPFSTHAFIFVFLFRFFFPPRS